MEQRLSLVTLGVTDLAAARAFYKRLGWMESPASNAEVAFFQCGGLVFALWGREALADDAGVQADAGFANISLAHNVRSKEAVDVALKEAKKAGATILKSGHGNALGRLHRILRGPRGLRLGGRLESKLRDPARRQHPAAVLARLDTSALPNVISAFETIAATKCA
jgi:catechol 2,3-dioxygenase-like lactoylglutathione lyase family enzyme